MTSLTSPEYGVGSTSSAGGGLNSCRHQLLLMKPLKVELQNCHGVRELDGREAKSRGRTGRPRPREGDSSGLVRSDMFVIMTATDQETRMSSGDSLDELAHDLQRLRLEAGAVSYTELATRVTQLRESRGMSQAAATVARSSVYDVFRPGRKRVNAELVGEIARALGCGEDEATAWRLRAAVARDETVQLHGYRPGGAKRGRNAALAVVLCVAAVGLSQFVNFTASALQLPLYLDMVGTACAAFAFGPWAGVAVGVATNLTGNLMHGDFSGWGFALVQIAGAVVWGYGFRGWFGRSRLRFLLLNAVVAVVCALVAVPVILIFFGGVSSLSSVAALADAVQQLGTGLGGALFSVNMLTSLADKLISGYLALLIVWALAHYGFALTETVRVRLGMVQPRPKA